MSAELVDGFLQWVNAYKEKVRVRLAFNRLKKELEAMEPTVWHKHVKDD